MGLKSFAAKYFAQHVHQKSLKWQNKPVETQHDVFKRLIANGKTTLFGEDHNFSSISTHKSFTENVPIRDYEGLKPYIQRILDGANDILWPGKPIYFAKTSGTTSGIKYIPITSESMPHHIDSARNALLAYIYETGNTDFLNGKMIFLSGSPELTEKSGIKTGRLSGIVNHHVPAYLKKSQLPRWETNIIEDWETKLDKIVQETKDEDMTLISGIPPWMQMYFDRLEEVTGEKPETLFPNFSIMVYGGVNFAPYRDKLFKTIGRRIDSIETYPASEGFFAYQNSQKENSLLLLLDSDIFYEFVPVSELGTANPTRLTIGQVKLNVNYALIISSNAGLWAYNIGDTVKFVSLFPHKIIVTGRVKHYISAFGEHVIAEEVEKSMSDVLSKKGYNVIEFTVAPQVTPIQGLPYHEWFIEFENTPQDLENLSLELDTKMQELNIYYKDLIEGKIIRPLVITPIVKNGFVNYMKSIGKLGGQNKLPRLSNDRQIADALNPYLLKGIPN